MAEPGAAAGPPRPLIVVPGFSGVVLRESGDGSVAWGTTRRLFAPRDGGRRLALPIDGDDGRPPLEPAGPVERIGGPLFTVDIYASLLESLEAAGYRRGSLDDPRPDDSLFVFGYDWRRSNVEAARELIADLRGLRERRGTDTLEVDVVCHSNAARILRWLLKYGDASIDEAWSGGGAPPPDLKVARLILVGSANGGSLKALRFIDRGRRYAPLGRRFRPEVVFTFVGLYEGLPVHLDDPVVDEDGRTVAGADPFDPASWRRYGWSIYRPDVASRLRRRGDDSPFGSAEERDRFLAATLDDARRFQELLARDAPGFGSTRYHAIQSSAFETARRAVLLPARGRSRLAFAGDCRVDRRDGLRDRVTAPGDRHATLASQRALSPQELRALADRTLYLEAPHRGLVADPRAHDHIAMILTRPRAAAPEGG